MFAHNDTGQPTSAWLCVPLEIYLHKILQISPPPSPHVVKKSMTHRFLFKEYVIARDTEDKSGPLEALLRIFNTASLEEQKNLSEAEISGGYYYK